MSRRSLPAASRSRALPQECSYQPSGPAWDVTYREINVIGKHAEEARDEVDKFLDSAALASVDRVRIVHGHGMGVLRRTIAELLATNPHVAQFYPASPAEGGTRGHGGRVEITVAAHLPSAAQVKFAASSTLPDPL